MLWIPFAIASAGLNSVWGALSKHRLGPSSSLTFSVIFRLIVVALYFPLFLVDRQIPGRVDLWLVAFLSGLINALVIALTFEGIRKDYYATYCMLNTSPAFAWLPAVLFLNEDMGPSVIAGTGLVIAGTFLFYRARQFSWPGLIAGIAFGINVNLNKYGVTISSPLTFPFLSYACSVTLMTLWLLASRRRQELLATARRWKSILPLSLFSVGAIWTGFSALSLAPVTLVVPVTRVRLLFGFLLSFFYLKEMEGWKHRILGGLVIAVGAVIVALSR
jgi:uncharacterized membrane protein